MKAKLNLLVLRVADIERSVLFYRVLGLKFTQHRHGTGPEHYACENDGLVFELYPRQNKGGNSVGTRLGFRVESVDASLAALEAQGGRVVSPPADSPWGRRAVIDDRDGHRVELTQDVSPAEEGI